MVEQMNMKFCRKVASFLFWIALPCIFATAQGSTANSKHAMELFRQQYWADAATAFAEVERETPGKTDALLFRAKALIEMGAAVEAESALRAYLASHPASGEASYLLARVLFMQDRSEDSVHAYESAAKLQPATSDELTELARVHIRLSDMAAAAAYLEKALTLDARNVEARHQLGRVLYKQGKLDDAIDAFEKVLQAQPTRIGALDNLGLTLERKGEYQRAMELYQKAIEVDKTSSKHNENPYLNQALLLVKLGKQEDALPLLYRAFYINSTCFRAQFGLGQAYFGLKRMEEALQHTEQAVALNPADGASHYFLARLYANLGKPELAEHYFQLTRELAAHNGGVHGAGTGMAKDVDMLRE